MTEYPKRHRMVHSNARLLWQAMLVLALFSAAPPCAACYCGRTASWKDLFQDADAVVQAMVIEKADHNAAGNGPADEITYRLVLQQTWKGDMPDTFALRTPASADACGLRMHKGTSYMVFATRTTDGGWTATRCGGSTRCNANTKQQLADLSGTALDRTPPSQRYRTRAPMWYTPSNANEINGLAIGLGASADWFHQDSIKVRGLDIELNPVALMLVLYTVGGSIESPFSRECASEEPWDPLGNKYRFGDSTATTIDLDGLAIGTALMGDTRLRGVGISGVGTLAQEGQGISISGVMNSFQTYEGLAIAGLQNKIKRGHGLQIALFNWSDDWHGVQIGLLNRIGDRITPFVNFRF